MTVPRGFWIAQTILRRGMLTALVELAGRYGQTTLDLVPFSLFGRQAYLAVDPRDIGTVLHDTASFRRAEIFLKPLRDLLGFNAVTVAAPEWRTVRQRTQRFLTGKNLEQYQLIMTRVLEQETIPQWRHKSRRGEPVDVFRDMLDYSSRVVFSAFLGVPFEEVPPHLHGTLNEMFDHVRRRVFSFVNVPVWIPTSQNLKFARSRDAVYAFVESLVERNPRAGSMLEALVEAHTSGQGLDRQRLLEEMLGNLIGGSETTIILMLWTIYYLAHDPVLQDRLHEAVTASPPDLHRNPKSLLNRCITEALRLRSPSYMAVREAIRPVSVRDVAIPAGAHVFASQYITHNDPRLWPQPERFDPDRFLAQPPRTAPDYTDFFPFGGGRNVCTGQAYAFQEAALSVSTLIRHFRFIPAQAFDAGVQAALTLRPARPVILRVEERDAPVPRNPPQRSLHAHQTSPSVDCDSRQDNSP
jgi:cytochrome P450